MRLTPKQSAIISWLIAITFFAGVGGYHIIPRLVYLHGLSESSATISGEIMETYPKDHYTCKYRFVLNNKFYEKIGNKCGDAAIGQTITVYYDLNDLEKSVNNNPEELFRNDLFSFLAAIILFPIFAAVVNYRRLKNRQLKNNLETP